MHWFGVRRTLSAASAWSVAAPAPARRTSASRSAAAACERAPSSARAASSCAAAPLRTASSSSASSLLTWAQKASACDVSYQHPLHKF